MIGQINERRSTRSGPGGYGAFGVRTEAFTGVQLVAATNIFVGMTRARELLGLAIRKASAASLLDAAVAQGWKIVDLGAIEPTGD